MYESKYCNEMKAFHTTQNTFSPDPFSFLLCPRDNEGSRTYKSLSILIPLAEVLVFLSPF